jgi:hypothetical protein
MGSPTVQIDIINKASGIDFEDCYKRKNIIQVDNIVITVISKNDLIVNKKASGREIETLVKRLQKSGEHEITWQPKSLPMGIYF